MRHDLISRIPLFASLPRAETEYLAHTLRPREFPPRSVLFREGTLGDVFYILLNGQIEIIKALGTGDERLLGVREAGSFIGEMSLFNRDGLRTASVRARTPVQTLEMTRAEFDALLHRYPSLGYDMVRVLSLRLEESENLTLGDLQEKNRQLTTAYEELKAAQAQIVEKEKLERELQVASKIQMSILPHKLPELAGYDFGVRILPMSAVGGDFYDLIPLEGDRLGIVVGDVSGHGVPAALFMAMTVTLLRAEACHNCSPREVLRGVNRHLLDLNDEGMFVTVLYGVLDGATREFTYARAGHEPPLMCQAGGDAIKLKMAHGQILGLFDDPPLAEQTVRMAPDSTLLLYTDGVVEAVNAHSEQFGEERLQEALCLFSHDSAQALCERILESVTAYCDAKPQNDDITLVSVQAKPFAGPDSP
jgi:sigma-B regulation protein RsbU (phosphoserine phosphatase)